MFVREREGIKQILLNGEWVPMQEGRIYDIPLTNGGNEFYCLSNGIVERSVKKTTPVGMHASAHHAGAEEAEDDWLSALDEADTVERVPVELPRPLKTAYVCKLDHAGLTAIGLRCLRDKSGVLQLHQPSHMRALTTACLQLALQLEDGKPYLGDPETLASWKRAWNFVSSKKDERIHAVKDLFAAITEMNPLILQRFGDETEADDADPLA